MLFFLSMSAVLPTGIHKLLYYVAELDVGLQLRRGNCLGVAQRAAEEAMWATPKCLLDALLAEAVAAGEGHRAPIKAQADGAGQLFLQSAHCMRLCHGI